MPDIIWWEKWDPRKGGHHFLQKNVFFLYSPSGNSRSDNQQDSVNSAGRRDSENIFGRNFRSRAQMKVQIIAMNSVQVSSKSELSSGTFDHVKVCEKITLEKVSVRVPLSKMPS